MVVTTLQGGVVQNTIMIVLHDWTKFTSTVRRAGRLGCSAKLFGNAPPAMHVPRMKMKVANVTRLQGEKSEGRVRLKPSGLAD